MTDDLTLAVARAIREAPMRDTLLGARHLDPDAPLSGGDMVRARAAIAALRAAGFAVVPTTGPGDEARIAELEAALFGCLEWMEELRVDTYIGFWDWKDGGAYLRGRAALDAHHHSSPADGDFRGDGK